MEAEEAAAAAVVGMELVEAPMARQVVTARLLDTVLRAETMRSRSRGTDLEVTAA